MRGKSRNIFYEKDDYIVGITTKGESFVFDKEDYDLVKRYTWSVNKEHLRANVNGKYLQLHRYIMNAGRNVKVDHVDTNPLNNRRYNLRTCTHQQNNWNMNKTKGKSKYKGVSWSSKQNKWFACTSFNNKTIYLGLHKNEDDAALAYNKKAVELFGEFARINIIGGNERETTSVLSYA